MKRILAATCLALLILVVGSPARAQASPPSWALEEGSRLGFRTAQGGAPVEGLFERFEAEIQFSAEDLEASRIVVVVDIASVNSESKERDDTIRSPSLLDVASWATARFETKSFRRVADDRFEALADLTLRDVTLEIVLPFTLEIVPHPEQAGRLQARARGEVAFLRLNYGVGQGIWSDTSVVPDEVVVIIDIIASRPAD